MLYLFLVRSLLGLLFLALFMNSNLYQQKLSLSLGKNYTLLEDKLKCKKILCVCGEGGGGRHYLETIN